RVGAIYLWVQHHLHAAQEVAERLLLQRGVREIGDAGVAFERAERQHKAHRELSLMDGARVCDRPKYINGGLMHMGADMLDLLCAQVMLLHRLQQGIGGWVGMTTGSVVFERGF